MNPYQVLGISLNASIDEAKQAYRKLAQALHPDRNKDAGAENRFKQVQAAWEAIQTGWKPPLAPQARPAPKPYSPSYMQRCVIRCTFRDSFTGSLMQVPGTQFVVKPPYGVSPGQTVRQTVTTVDMQGQDIFEITWEVYDPNGFYKVEILDGKPVLTARLIGTAAQMLASQEVTLPNINPQASSFNVRLQATSPIIVPMAGLSNSNGRGKLYLYLDIIYKELQDERYDVLIELQGKINKAIADAKDRIF